MPFKDNICIELFHPEYVPILKDNSIHYGGSQMWLSNEKRYGKDYILHNYGCGTIATADLFLYLALQKESYQTAITSMALNNENEINYNDYTMYLHTINKKYTKTRPVLAVLGPSVASAINSYSSDYGLGLKATWKWVLNYYDMYDLIEEMLWKNLPVILSIGPNTPNLWGKKGIPFYELKEIDYMELNETDTGTPSETDTTEDPFTTTAYVDSTDGLSDNTTESSAVISKVPSKPYYYHAIKQNICGHYVTVTALIKDEVTGRIMLRISSWGRQYYINYEEYRDYIESIGGTFTSSIVYIKENY